MNPGLPAHMICSDRRVFKEFLQNRKVMPFVSLGLLNSVFELFDDLPRNLPK